MWHTALLAPWFVSSALVCGTALVLVVAIALRRAGYLSLDQAYHGEAREAARRRSSWWTCTSSAATCSPTASPAARGAEVVAMLTAGPLAPLLLDGGRRLRPLRRHLLHAGAAHQRPAGRRLAARDPRHLLQARAAARRRLPDRQPGLRRPAHSHAAHGRWIPASPASTAGMVYWPTPLEFGVTLGVVALGACWCSCWASSSCPFARKTTRRLPSNRPSYVQARAAPSRRGVPLVR